MNPGPYLKPYGIWERLQLSMYFAQETGISLLYVWEVLGMLKPQEYDPHSPRKRLSSVFSTTGTGRKWRSESSRLVLKHLIYINFLIMALDVSLLITEYIGHYEIQVLYKVTNYFFNIFHSSLLQETNRFSGISLLHKVKARIQNPESAHRHRFRASPLKSSIFQ
jgi:hypothetical protein